jgi:hypothetical protein
MARWGRRALFAPHRSSANLDDLFGYTGELIYGAHDLGATADGFVERQISEASLTLFLSLFSRMFIYSS